MKLVELYGKVRYAVQIEGISRREAARRFGIDPRTVAKMLSFSVPPGYRRRLAPEAAEAGSLSPASSTGSLRWSRAVRRSSGSRPSPHWPKTNQPDGPRSV